MKSYSFAFTLTDMDFTADFTERLPEGWGETGTEVNA